MAAQNNAPLPDGLEIAGYRIVKKIASGGFSIVYLATDEDGNAVAIKEYLPSSLALRQVGELVPAISAENFPIYRIGLKCFLKRDGRSLGSPIQMLLALLIFSGPMKQSIYGDGLRVWTIIARAYFTSSW